MSYNLLAFIVSSALLMSFIINNKNNIYFGAFDELVKQNIIAHISFRQGGFSTGAYQSLNLGLHVDDNRDLVIKNRKEFFNIINVHPLSIITLKQIHSNKVILVGQNDAGRGATDYDDAVAEADALVTNEINTPLVILTADCLPVFFYETHKRIIGLAHAGWQGTQHNITSNTIQKIIELGGKVDNILVGLGPCIGKCCYEVGLDFYNIFNDKYLEIKNERYYFNLTEANYNNLITSGIKHSHIIKSDFCTFCHHDLCFSYRKECKTGRMASVIMLCE